LDQGTKSQKKIEWKYGNENRILCNRNEKGISLAKMEDVFSESMQKQNL
jgi:hypothetical protein